MGVTSRYVNLMMGMTNEAHTKLTRTKNKIRKQDQHYNKLFMTRKKKAPAEAATSTRARR